MAVEQLTWDEWQLLGRNLHPGRSALEWEFCCPRCGHVQSIVGILARNPGKVTEQDAADLVYFSCEGRLNREVGCDWTLGGLMQIHKREVLTEDGKHVPVFLFASEVDDYNETTADESDS